MKIDRDTYLKALALFTIAHDHAQKAAEFCDQLAQVLGRKDWNDLDHIGDEVWNRGSHWGFDEALKLAGFEFDPPLPTPPQSGK